MPNRKKRKDDPSDTPEYRKLVENLRKIIDDAAGQGVDLRKRDDTLTCRACGAYENVLFSGQWVVCDRGDNVISDKEFIIIDRKERSTHRKKMTYYKSTYEFICPICGAQQVEIVRESFDDIY